MRLRIDEKVAAKDDLVANCEAAGYREQIVGWSANCDFASFKDPIGPGEIDDFACARVEHRGARDDDRLTRRGADKAGVDKHAGQKTHAGIGDMHVHGNGSRLRAR